MVKESQRRTVKNQILRWTNKPTAFQQSVGRGGQSDNTDGERKRWNKEKVTMEKSTLEKSKSDNTDGEKRKDGTRKR